MDSHRQSVSLHDTNASFVAAKLPRFYAMRRFSQIQQNILSFLAEIDCSYGHVTHFKGLTKALYFLNDPTLIQEVLVQQPQAFTKSVGLKMAKKFILGDGLLTSEGALHRRQRKLCAPAFRKKHITRYAQSMVDFARTTSQQWQDGQQVDMDQEMMQLTLSIVAQTLFSADVEDNTAEIYEALSAILQIFPRIVSPFARILNMLPLPSTRRFRRSSRTINETIFRIIKERRAAPETTHHDLLAVLLNAQDEDDGTGMSDQQLRDEVVTFFLAGHETTANALSWTWMLLSQNPEIEERLHQEIDNVLAQPLSPAEVYPQLVYTRQVLAESMRLYPPAPLIGRDVVEDVTLCGLPIKKGGLVILSPYITQRDVRFWPEPTRFDPDRWSPDAGQEIEKFTYFPFGGGPRICIGEPFAWMEGVLLLAYLARDWKPRLVYNQTIELLPQITLRPKNGMPMVLHRR